MATRFRVKIENDGRISVYKTRLVSNLEGDAESSLLSGRIFFPYGNSLKSLKTNSFLDLLILSALIQRLLLSVRAGPLLLPAVMV